MSTDSAAGSADAVPTDLVERAAPDRPVEPHPTEPDILDDTAAELAPPTHPENGRARRQLMVRTFRAELWWSALNAVFGTVGTALEALTLVLVVQIGTTLAGSQGLTSSGLPGVISSLTPSTACLLALASIVTSLAVTSTSVALANRIRTRWTKAKRLEMVERFVDAEWQAQNQNRAGGLQTLSSYVESAASVLAAGSTALKALLSFGVFMASSLLISPVALLGILAAGALLYAILRPLSLGAKRQSRALAWSQKEFNEELGEVTVLSRDVFAFGVADEIMARSEERTQELSRRTYKIGVLTALVAPMYQGAALVLLVSVLLVASRQEAVNIATIGAVAVLALRSMSYGQQFQTSHSLYQQAVPVLELLNYWLENLRRQATGFGAAQLSAVEQLELRNISFRYEDSRDAALDDVSLSLRRGELVGIAGPSGAGKSTLAQILLRLQRPSSGDYLVNGTDAWSFDRTSWAAEVSLVPQEGRLLHGTVEENVAFYRPGVGRDDVEVALEQAHLLDAVGELPGGLDEPIGPSTRNLSGGQVQRLALARALAGRPTVLVLDEPTSALDAPTESAIHDVLEGLRGRCAVVIIAHRLSTLAICDRVIVLDAGRMVSAGPIAEVRTSNEFLARAFATGNLSADQGLTAAS